MELAFILTTIAAAFFPHNTDLNRLFLKLAGQLLMHFVLHLLLIQIKFINTFGMINIF